jgi:L-seryl-tRNA(Ser) seleniumtransferase
MDDESKTLMRMIPSVDSVLRDPRLTVGKTDLGTTLTTAVVREVIDDLRKQLAAGEGNRDAGETDVYERILTETMHRLDGIARPHYGPVVNGTGVILHTGLGRAVLAGKVLEQIQTTLQGYSLLQLDAETGGRSKRDDRIEWLLQRLTGAEAATVVNNNAAATAIVLNTVARDREVIVSRGQLVEIGGSFRLPDVMAFSGAKLVEVGTTNKTHPRDYENAVTERTAAILRVHPSNYKIQGFSSEVPLATLAGIAHDRQLTLIDDVGAGALIDFSQFGFEPEPTLPDSIRDGADIVTCSADKLIGASQGGIILGTKKWIDAIRKNQFARIVRVGKLTLAALEATLKLFLDESVALREVPTLQMLRRSGEEIREHAERLARELSEQAPAAKVTTVPGFSQMGSGSLPTQNLATTLVAIAPRKISAEFLAKRLRVHTPPVIARIQNDQVLIDPRTLRKGDDAIILKAVAASLDEGKRGC